MLSLLRQLTAVLLALLATSSSLHAYRFTGSRWSVGSATFQLQLGTTSGTLMDGFATWGASAEDALSLWNTQMSGFRFAVVRDSTASRAGGNRTNNVFFSGDIYGDAWGANVLAVTLTYTIGSTNTETDVLFNNRLNWNSYRGALRYSATGAAIYDFHRVALHEFGHALGLDHPDEHGQVVSALMNSRITSLDTITADDISGAQALYGAAVVAPVVAAPVITSQPVSRSVTAGQSATFSVVATGGGTLAYQWLKGSTAIAGATGATLTFPSAATTDAANYSVVVTNAGGSVTSSAATLTVNPAVVTTTPPATTTTPPTTTTTAPPTTFTPIVPPPTAPAVIAPSITEQPVSRSVNAGSFVAFAVSATGTAPISYQWRKNGVTINGATGSTYSLPAVQSGDAGSYSVLVANTAGSALSTAATLSINIAPTITTQPVAQTVAPGARASLGVVAAGTAPLSYQWRKDGTALGGATAATLTIAASQAADDGTYLVVVTNVAGSVTSAPARLSVSGPPVITTQPIAQTVTSGDRVTLNVVATSVGTPAYQWLKNGAEIAGATAATYTLAAARPMDIATYSVRITNSAGSVTSAAVALAVRFSRLTNLSTRGFVPAGGALTPGFYVRGTESKSLLVRAVGPTLSLFGVGSALSEAKLDVIAQDTSTVVASNNDWGGTTALSNTFASVGAFPLAADSKDAAVQTSLLPRSYTVRVAPDDATISGITLAEIYDVDVLAGSASQLVNVSTLGFVGTGDNVLTAGFVVSGNAPKRLLVRAVGPGLAPFGVGSLLADPQVGVVPLGGSEPVATNDDWSDTAALRAAFTAAGAFNLPSGSKDAALVITLEPGAYTVVVSGVSSTSTGNALVEIYDLDP